jgi:hypothetical protein
MWASVGLARADNISSCSALKGLKFPWLSEFCPEDRPTSHITHYCEACRRLVDPRRAHTFLGFPFHRCHPGRHVLPLRALSLTVNATDRLLYQETQRYGGSNSKLQ